jgi:hypothetical protein
MTFTTQKQIWEHLIANEGKPCVKDSEDDLFGLKDGSVYNFSLNIRSDKSFIVPSNWQPYTEPEKCWLDDVMPTEASKSSQTYCDFFRTGAKSLAHEAIKRIEAQTGLCGKCDLAVSILKNLIGESDGK